MLILTFSGLVALLFVSLGIGLFGLDRTLTRADMDIDRRRKVITRVLIVVFVWLAFTAALAQTEWLAVWDTIPPRLPIIPLAAFTALILLNRLPIFPKLLAATPRHWPVALQTFRIGVELAFLGLYLAGGAPKLVTFEGRNFDILVGLTAPIVAFAIYRFKLNPRAVVAWNILGLAILGNTVYTAITAQPGPLHHDWPGEPFTAFATWPFVWIPAFLAPLAVFLHLFSIRRNVAMMREK